MRFITRSAALLTVAAGLFLTAGCGRSDAPSNTSGAGKPTARAKKGKVTDEVYVEVMAQVLALGQKVPILLKQGKMAEIPKVTDAIDAVYAKHGVSEADIEAFSEKVQGDPNMEHYRVLFGKIDSRINELRPEYGLPPARNLAKEAEDAMRDQ